MSQNNASSSKIIINELAHFLPQTEVDNAFFDALDIGSDAEFISSRTGILSRRSVLTKDQIKSLRAGETTHIKLAQNGEIPTLADMAKQTWELIHSDISSLDYLLCGTSCPDWEIPANACNIAAEIQMEHTPSFDVNSACSSFIFNLHTARGLAQISRPEMQLAIFNPERYSTRMDFSDRNSCILFGDGSIAALLSKSGSGLEVLDTAIHSDPSGYRSVQIPVHRTFWQNGKAVQRFAISKTVASSKAILDKNDLTIDDIDFFIGHQANLRMLQSAAKKLGFSEDQHLYNVDKYGNQGAAGAPSVLAENWNRFEKGQKVLVTAVGSGLSWGSAILQRI